MGTFIENVDDLCRICATYKEQMLSIYNDQGAEYDLESKIKTFLPFIILTKNDILPKSICLSCASTLLLFNDLWEIGFAANERFNSFIFNSKNKLQKTDQENNKEQFDKDLFLHVDEIDRNLSSMEPTTEPLTDNEYLCTPTAEIKDIPEKLSKDETKVSSKINVTKPISDVKRSPLNEHNNQNRSESFPILLDALTRRPRPTEQDAIAISENAVSGHDHTYAMPSSPPPPPGPRGLCDKCGRVFKQTGRLDVHRARCKEKTTATRKRKAAPSATRKQKAAFFERFRVDADGRQFYKCDQCPFYTMSGPKSAMYFRRHYKLHTTGFDLPCDRCPRKFRTAYALNSHVDNVHHRLKKAVCPQCGKKFANRNALSDHWRVHTDVRPYACPECGKTFRHRSRVEKHVRSVHRKEKDHQCPVCGKSYFTASLVRVHMTQHTGVRDHACRVCGKAFRTKKTLNEHAKSVHGGPGKFVCDLCGRAYKMKRSLVLHLQTVHDRVLADQPPANREDDGEDAPDDVAAVPSNEHGD